ncbi:MAG: PD-(D/E)XK nuclease-like domain-containing protein [Polyangiaceae bacterium]|nr:PD-(D/E)XK nuclease-like domain-containing protein [Polyangiaceae bacterium]
MLDYNLTFDEYLALPGEHFSSIKEMHRSPAHYRSRVRPADSDALRTGRALHAAILDPASIKIVEYAGVRRGKEWNAFQQDHADELILTPKQAVDVRGMRASVHAHRHASRLLRNGRPEVTARFEVDGVPFKARLDFVCTDSDLIEVKSTRDNHPQQFEREFARRLYHAQVALYRMALQANGLPCRKVYSIAICKTPPFEVVVYDISEETIETGARWVRDWVARLKECERARAWPGIDNGNILTLRIPDWAISDGLPDIEGDYDE